MDKIYLQIDGDGTGRNPKRARFILGEHFVGLGEDAGVIYLSGEFECASDVELEVARLRELLDKAVAKAKQQLPD